MEQINWWILFLSAFIPLIVGFIWYNPKVLGGLWLIESGLSQEEVRSGNRLKRFGLLYLFSLLGSFTFSSLVVHQSAIIQLFLMDPDLADPSSAIGQYISDFYANYGDRHRSFGHGVIHGIEGGLFVGLMILGSIAVFERKSWKYIAVNLGYWIVSLALMGGVMCAYL